MRTLTLREFQTSARIALTAEERDELLKLREALTITPSVGEDGLYDITPGSWVGAIHLDTLALEIRPKLPVSRVLFLLSYAMNPQHWKASDFDFEQEESLLEGIIPGFAQQVRKATYLGVLQGYRTEEAALSTVRGRVRFDDQIKQRFGLMPPVEVRYDEFTEDIEENRLLKAALERLRRMRIRAEWVRQRLRAFDLLMQPVSLVEYDPWGLPDILYTRLNEHYRPAVELAKLILRASAFELSHGGVRASVFLVDMNKVFEDFAIVALREALQVTPYAFPQGAHGRHLRLDTQGYVRLAPDISWWEEGRCVFVGDLKYKKLKVAEVKNADMYQLLAYTVATGLPSGLLIYAAGEDEPRKYDVVGLGKQLEVKTLDLAGTPEEILGQIDNLAEVIRDFARSGRVVYNTQ